jgi:hypothetical protein
MDSGKSRLVTPQVASIASSCGAVVVVVVVVVAH